MAFKYTRSLYEVDRDAPTAPRHRPRRHNRDHQSGSFIPDALLQDSLTSYRRLSLSLIRFLSLA